MRVETHGNANRTRYNEGHWDVQHGWFKSDQLEKIIAWLDLIGSIKKNQKVVRFEPCGEKFIYNRWKDCSFYVGKQEGFLQGVLGKWDTLYIANSQWHVIFKCYSMHQILQMSCILRVLQYDETLLGRNS